MKITINPEILRRAALKIISLIQQNTNNGIDQYGKPFKPYSTKPFSMPAGSYYQNTSLAQRKVLNESLIWRTSKSGSKWITVKGGYAAYKSARFPQDGGVVNLQYRGFRGNGMLNSLQIIEESPENGYIIIGFSNSQAAQIASYHQVLGAGKSRVLRKFMGINENDVEKVLQEFKNQIAIQY